MLVTRRGTPAALAILLSDLLRRLLLSGAIDFAAKINFTSDMSKAPTAELIPGVTRAQAVTQAPETPHQSENNTNSPNTTTSTTTSSSSSSGTLGVLTLNTCTSDALVECLRYLKRSYWPFQWDPMAGGFRGAAKAYLDGADSAEAEAIARTARHRLERGIWTSPGGGDLRRAIAAAERLVILRGEEASEERRDLAVLYCHAGRLPEAKAELKARAKAVAGRSAAGGGGARRPPVISLSPDTGVSVAASFDELPDAVLEDRLLALLCQVPMGQGGAVAPLSVEEGMRRAQAKGGGEGTVMPLTW